MRLEEAQRPALARLVAGMDGGRAREGGQRWWALERAMHCDPFRYGPSSVNKALEPHLSSKHPRPDGAPANNLPAPARRRAACSHGSFEPICARLPAHLRGQRLRVDPAPFLDPPSQGFQLFLLRVPG